MLKTLAIHAIRIYQKFLSPLSVSSCRFTPSCSSYAIQAFETHGFLRGLILTLVRISKCHPFHPGGLDPVPIKHLNGKETYNRNHTIGGHYPALEHPLSPTKIKANKKGDS
jgi:putative membrane protein insertion efficiency factor